MLLEVKIYSFKYHKHPLTFMRLGSACDDETGTGTGTSDDPSDGLIKLRKRNTFNKRETLDCSSAETCYQYTDDSLLCVNLSDGEELPTASRHNHS